MKRVLSLLLALSVMASCTSPRLFIVDGTAEVVRPYGLINKKAVKNDRIVYEPSAGNIIISALTLNTLVVPLWLIGWKMYQPVGVKPSN